MRRALWPVVAVFVALGPSPAPSLREGGALGSAADREGDVGVAARGAGGPQRAGVLRVGVTRLGSLDPAQARSLDQLQVADQLFDSLTALDPVTLEPVPSLAQRWVATPDQRQWTFFLRRGAVFANGRAVTAGDVKYSLERVARRGVGSPGAELLTGVAGYLDHRSGAPGLAGITAPSAHVVRIVLEQPLADFATVVASPVLGVVAREAVESAPPAPAFADAPVGSGPFRLGGRGGREISLVRSRTVPQASGSAQPVQEVRVVQYASAGEAYRAFTAGMLDWARVPPQEVEAAEIRFGDGAFRPYVAQLFFGFNLRSPKLADVRFREAIVRAIDRRAVVAAVYQGTARAGDSLVAEGVPGHQPGACRRCAHDPGRARELLIEAFPGRVGVPEVRLDYDSDPTQEAIGRSVQASLADVGIEATLRPRPVDDYDDFLVSDEPEVFRLGWVAAYPSPEAFLSPMFRSGSADNLTGFADKEVDELLSSARAEPDPAQRTALYREAERTILDAVAVIPMAQFEVHAVVSKRVRGLIATSLGTFDASTVSLAGSR